jgi:hypothetical protein
MIEYEYLDPECYHEEGEGAGGNSRMIFLLMMLPRQCQRQQILVDLEMLLP